MFILIKMNFMQTYLPLYNNLKVIKCKVFTLYIRKNFDVCIEKATIFWLRVNYKASNDSFCHFFFLGSGSSSTMASNKPVR